MAPDWTLAAGNTCKSSGEAAGNWPSLCGDVSNAQNLPISGGQHSERDANTAYVLQGESRIFGPCANRWA